MITKDNYSEEHIRELQKISRRDPGLIERTLYAFGLLEALVQVGLPFTFKGGTSLLLLLEKPMRLSTDIDIVVKPGTDMKGYIEAASKIFPFTHQEEQSRVGRNNIEKKHYKFTYASPIQQKPLYILLDVLFEEDNYSEVVTRNISNSLLLMEGEPLCVRVPSVDCILGDKLTAFAPHTTGIPLHQKKDMEVMKQFYDICTMLDVLDNMDNVKDTYKNIVRAEIDYRGIDIKLEDVLLDTLYSAIAIGARGKVMPEDYPAYVRGSRDVRTHIYAEDFSPEIAAMRAPKIIYMAACLLTDHVYERNFDVDDLVKETLFQNDLKVLKYLKKVNPEGYAYVIMADRLLADYIR
ncbi:MAG: nucleotidyl transferase AbiEii/AbiGii toxin family protein [Lachnospiraceae bacterium]|nr:nucleotidyl transferase AbiEii/AbiGii toxin family protein [Lachnospiraceae bacterium]